MHIRVDDLRGPEIAALLQEHLDDMYATSPPESVHALDIEKLRHPSITFWTIWDGEVLAGCIALKALSATTGEIKSMRTPRNVRGKGASKLLLAHLLAEATSRGYTRVSLETGTEDYFRPARTLYERHGFIECGPFGDYMLDPHSAFMTLALPRA
jgi:putative acetyltransferase